MLLLFHYLGECQESQREEKAFETFEHFWGENYIIKDSEAESAKSFVRERSIPVQCPGNDMDLYSF